MAAVSARWFCRHVFQCGVGRPRRPAATLLHRTVREQLETYLARGFARAYCHGCGHDFLIAKSFGSIPIFMVWYQLGKVRREHPPGALIIMLRTILAPDSSSGIPDYDLYPGGQSMLGVQVDEDAIPREIRVITNFFDEIRRVTGEGPIVEKKP